MPITIKNSAGGGVTLDSTTTSNETLQLPSGGGTLAPLASPVFTGNVGIGVVPEASSSAYKSIRLGQAGLIVGKTSTEDLYIGSNFYFDASSVQNYTVSAQASAHKMYNGIHAFQVAPSGTADAAISWTTAMTIDNTGQVQLGSPPASAEYILNIKAKATSSTMRFQTMDGYNAISFYNTANTQNGYIRSNTSGVVYSTTSDYRLKTDVQPMTGATDRVKLLKPCNFEWIVDGTRVDGFIAHEAQEVVPESVTGTKDAMRDEEYEVTLATDTEEAVMGTRSVPDMQGIDQSKLVPLLTATIQELIARIEALENN